MRLAARIAAALLAAACATAVSTREDASLAADADPAPAAADPYKSHRWNPCPLAVQTVRARDAPA